MTPSPAFAGTGGDRLFLSRSPVPTADPQVVVPFDNGISLWPLRERLRRTRELLVVEPGRNRFHERVLHEALKYVAVGHLATLVMTDTEHLTWFGAKAAVSRLFPEQFALEADDRDGALRILRFRRVRPAPAHLVEPCSGWTFGILTLGDRPDAVAAFAASARASAEAAGLASEVVVVAPRGAAMPPGPDVRHLVVEEPAGRAWITRKKNAIVEAARHTDLLIVHDRFTVTPTFCADVARWGHAYAIAAPRVRLPDGRRALDWGVVTSRNDTWSKGGRLSYRATSPFAYVPGGATLVRRAAALRYPWNEHLFWNEHEDVELCRRMQRAGELVVSAPGMLVASQDRWADANPILPYDDQCDVLLGPPAGEQRVRWVPAA